MKWPKTGDWGRETDIKELIATVLPLFTDSRDLEKFRVIWISFFAFGYVACQLDVFVIRISFVPFG